VSALLDIAGLSKIYSLQDAAFHLWPGRAHHRSLHAVDDISFAVAPGESLGLVGESGCGKSTAVRLIARLIDTTAGTIAFDGRDISAVPAKNFGRDPLRRAIQVVFQDPTDSLDPRYSAFETIAEPIRLLDRAESRDALRERVMDAARLVGLPEELISRLPHQLSGGQKARVNIARAIAVRPRLLILDEPTSALDVSVQAVILRLLDDLRRKLGMSYLFVSHDLNVVRLLCHRVAVMYLGRIVESGPVDEVFNAPRHPYTRALIEAIPGWLGEKSARLSGEPMSPIDPDPATCRFYGRCPIGRDICHRQMPPLELRGGSHPVACHTPLGVPAPAAAVS
jgi:oligopeptide/dipeptide ABC transporter ATP-binding protein